MGLLCDGQKCHDNNCHDCEVHGLYGQLVDEAVGDAGWAGVECFGPNVYAARYGVIEGVQEFYTADSVNDLRFASLMNGRYQNIHLVHVVALRREESIISAYPQEPG